jgi:TolB-like protein/DNA-binding winged helix-turn-helix (wHTH) protein/tetratricopeptide (TPR) repeat protein
MSQGADNSRFFEFGPYRLDRDAKVLFRQGEIVALTPKVFDTLAALAAKPGEVRSKDDLLQAVWPDSFVEESNLAQNISVLRKTLGNGYIETVPKRGYRFVPPAQDHPVSADQVSPPNPAANGARTSSRRRWSFWASCAAAFSMLVLGLLSLQRLGNPDIQSLAVLPFKNLSGDPSQDYFAEGVTDLVTEQLAKRLPLRVISRTSASQFRNSTKPARTIGSELQADALVEGSATRTGDRVRITVNLIRAATDLHLWAETYDLDLADVPVLQKEIARTVAKQIHTQVVGEDGAPPAVSRSSFESLIRARYYWNRRTASSIAEAVSWFQKSIDEDPANAHAYAGLADCYNQLGTVMIGTRPPAETRKLALAAARRALEIDPALAEAHAALGYIAMYEWNWSRAGSALERALRLNPNYAPAHLWLAHLFSIQGRDSEALQQVGFAQELDPLSPIMETQRGWILIHARRYEEAIKVLRSVTERHPGYQWALWQLGMGLAHKGDLQQAVDTLEGAVGQHRTHAFLGFLGNVYGRAGRRDDALRVLEELHTASRHGYVSPHSFLFVYLGLGDSDKAFETLERSFAERSNGVAWMAVSPDYDPIRHDPRFKDFVARIALDRVFAKTAELRPPRSSR